MELNAPPARPRPVAQCLTWLGPLPLLILAWVTACGGRAENDNGQCNLQATPIQGPAPRGLFPRIVPQVGYAQVIATQRAADGDPGTAAIVRISIGSGAHGALEWGTRKVLIDSDEPWVNWADTPALSPDGETCAWLRRSGAGTYDYQVALTRVGETATRRLHDHDGPGEHGFVSLAAGTEDGLVALWLDGRATVEGGAMQLRTRRVSGEGNLGPETLLDARVCDCCPTALVRTASGVLVAAYRGRSAEEVRDIAVTRRAPEGDWSVPVVPHPDHWMIEGCPVNGPALAAQGEQVALAWFGRDEGDQATISVALSEDSGEHFGPRQRVDLGVPIGQLDVAFLPGGMPVVSWLEGPASVAAEGRWLARGIAPNGDGLTLGEPVTLATLPATRAAGRLRLAEAQAGIIAVWGDSDQGQLRGSLLSLASPK